MIHSCLGCGKSTANPKYCSRSCAVRISNTISPRRRKKARFCKHCKTAPVEGRNTVCVSCNRLIVDWTAVTIADMQGRRAYQINSRIREHARQLFWKHNPTACCGNCGYSKHIEVCHVHAISSFGKDTPISKINSLSNLVGLCPNCHWELDHGHLQLRSAP